MRAPGYGYRLERNSSMQRSLALLAARFATVVLVLCLVVVPVCSSWCAAKACSLPAPTDSSSTGCHHRASSSSPSSQIGALNTAGFCPAANDLPAALRPESPTSVSSRSLEPATERILAAHFSSPSWFSPGLWSRENGPLQLSPGTLSFSPSLPLRL